jgi:hypothetical protein
MTPDRSTSAVVAASAGVAAGADALALDRAAR